MSVCCPFRNHTDEDATACPSLSFSPSTPHPDPTPPHTLTHPRIHASLRVAIVRFTSVVSLAFAQFFPSVAKGARTRAGVSFLFFCCSCARFSSLLFSVCCRKSGVWTDRFNGSSIVVAMYLNGSACPGGSSFGVGRRSSDVCVCQGEACLTGRRDMCSTRAKRLTLTLPANGKRLELERVCSSNRHTRLASHKPYGWQCRFDEEANTWWSGH